MHDARPPRLEKFTVSLFPFVRIYGMIKDNLKHRDFTSENGGIMMQNRVTVTIADQRYTFLSPDEKEYVDKVAAHVDAKIRETMKGGNTALLDAAILTAMNLADDHFKDLETAENLRRQLKDYLDESARLKLELSEAKREIFKLQNKK